MTQRAFLVGTIGLCFYFISVTNGLPPAFSVLTWLALSLLIASGAVALLSLQGLKCRFHVTRASGAAAWPASTHAATANDATARAENERAPQLEVRLDNGGTLNKTGLVLTVKLRAENATREYSRRFVVEALPSNKNLAALLPLENLPRGLYAIEEVRITGSDVLGLFRVTARYKAALCGEGALRVAVAPAHLEARAASTRGGESGARRGERGSDDELRGTRPFVAGDDLRAVHWRTTARLGRLVVREFDATSRRRAFVVWDGGASTREAALSRQNSPREYSRRDAKMPRVEESALEQSLRLAMSLCAALSRRGHDCVLLRLDAKPQRISSDAAAFPARCGESLATAAQGRIAPLSSGASLISRGGGSRGGGRGDAFFVVAHRTDETLLQLCRAWRAQGVEVSVALVESAAPSLASTRAKKNSRNHAVSNANATSQKTSTNRLAKQENEAARAATSGAVFSGDALSGVSREGDAALNASGAALNSALKASTRGSVSASALRSDAPATKSGAASTRRNSGGLSNESLENGAAFFGETTRVFAAQIQNAGARVVIVEAGGVEANGDARETIETAMNVLLEGGARRSSRESGASNGAGVSVASAPIISATRAAAETVEETTQREVIS